jgi:hypothetical protein
LLGGRGSRRAEVENQNRLSRSFALPKEKNKKTAHFVRGSLGQIKTPSEGETFADHTQKCGRRLSRRLDRRRRVSKIAFARRRASEPVSDPVHAPLPSELYGGIRALQGILVCWPGDAPVPCRSTAFTEPRPEIQNGPEADRTIAFPPSALHRGLSTAESRLPAECFGARYGSRTRDSQT